MDPDMSRWVSIAVVLSGVFVASVVSGVIFVVVVLVAALLS